MSTTSAICQHSATYLDVDEVKCRACSQSMTYPRRPPGPEDEQGRRRDTRIASGEHRRRDSSPVEVEAEVEQLLCHCCRMLLAPGDFYRNNSPRARHRGYRAWRCKGCTSFRLRVQRELKPEAIRQQGRERRQRMIDDMTPEQREHGRKKTTRKDNASAVKRYQARKSGTPVPLRRAGRTPLYLKQICRISESCPLRRFCSTESKNLA